MKIEWTTPPPRGGWRGAWDRFVGPGATDAELWLQLGAAALAVGGVAAAAVWAQPGWTAVQLIIVALLALDLTGGVVTNATGAAKRWYHRAGQGGRQHLGFVAAHLHPFLVAWIFGGGDWLYGGLIYGYLLAAAGLIVATPLYLKRPLAMLLYLGGLLLGLYAVTSPPALEWFVPVFYLKLLISHLLPEAPFTPQ